MAKFIDITGQRFGRLTVIGKARVNNRFKWHCKCDCGKETFATTTELKKSLIQSCGCLHIERVIESHTLHGCRNKRVYTIWQRMRDRCNNPKHKSYHRYGGRGITVCSEWNNSFTKFYEWAMSSGYEDGLTIDRIDNDKGYFPDNCQWLTSVENTKKKILDRKKHNATL